MDCVHQEDREAEDADLRDRRRETDQRAVQGQGVRVGAVSIRSARLLAGSPRSRSDASGRTVHRCARGRRREAVDENRRQRQRRRVETRRLGAGLHRQRISARRVHLSARGSVDCRARRQDDAADQRRLRSRFAGVVAGRPHDRHAARAGPERGHRGEAESWRAERHLHHQRGWRRARRTSRRHGISCRARRHGVPMDDTCTSAAGSAAAITCSGSARRDRRGPSNRSHRRSPVERLQPDRARGADGVRRRRQRPSRRAVRSVDRRARREEAHVLQRCVREGRRSRGRGSPALQEQGRHRDRGLGAQAARLRRVARVAARF